MSKLNEDQKAALEGLKQVEPEIPQKFIQIVIENNLPQINYVGVTIPEVLGTLEMCKALIIEKRLIHEVKKQNYQQMLELI